MKDAHGNTIKYTTTSGPRDAGARSGGRRHDPSQNPFERAASGDTGPSDAFQNIHGRRRSGLFGTPHDDHTGGMGMGSGPGAGNAGWSGNPFMEQFVRMQTGGPSSNFARGASRGAAIFGLTKFVLITFIIFFVFTALGSYAFHHPAMLLFLLLAFLFLRG